MPCEQVYIEETGRIINLQIKEYQRDVRLKHVTQSALSEHNIETGHQILFDKTITIANITSYFLRKYRGEIQKHPNNLNRDNGYNINKIWKIIFPVIEDRSISSPPLHSHPQFFSFLPPLQ